jgi:hypothetical protein
LDGCGHVDCALKASGGGIFGGIIIALFLTGFAAFGIYIMIQEGEYAWIIMLIPAIASIAFSYLILTDSWRSEKVIEELNEFRACRTVYGLKAQMIEDNSDDRGQFYFK